MIHMCTATAYDPSIVCHSTHTIYGAVQSGSEGSSVCCLFRSTGALHRFTDATIATRVRPKKMNPSTFRLQLLLLYGSKALLSTK